MLVSKAILQGMAFLFRTGSRIGFFCIFTKTVSHETHHHQRP